MAMHAVVRFLMVIVALSGSGALHAAAGVVEGVACEDACASCEDSRESCDEGCGVLCACCPAPAFAAPLRVAVSPPAITATALRLDPVGDASPGDARGLFIPPRS
jgi:hypothetical protein